MTLRVAFYGFDPLAVEIYEVLLDFREKIEVVGWVGKELEKRWPSNLDPPDTLPDLRSLWNRGGADVLIAARNLKENELEGFNGEIVYIKRNSPTRLILKALLEKKGDAGRELEEMLQFMTGISERVPVFEAYTDPLPKLEELLAQAISCCRADLGYLFLRGEMPDELVLQIAQGKGSERFAGTTFKIEGSLLAPLMEERRGFLMEVVPEEYPGGDFIKKTDTRYIMAVPLLAGGSNLGAIMLARSGGENFSAMELGVLSATALHACAALHVAHLYSDLDRSTIRDTVSDLFNESYFRQRLSDEVGRARRYSLNLCLMVMEVDGLDSYLERNGDIIGELAISDLGNIILKNTREVDVPARYGHDQFAILLPETRRLGAMRLAERLSKVISEYPFPTRDKKKFEQLTVCIGIASYPANADSEEMLLENALKALEVAKRESPHQIRLFSEELI